MDSASAVLQQNWRDGYTIPSQRLYPFQWNWDSGFIALGWGYLQPERALTEIRSMFLGQWSNGMLPHIVFHRPNPNYFPGPEVWRTAEVAAAPPQLQTSGITQPPVYGFILDRLASLPGFAGPSWLAFLGEILPKITAFHRYLYTCRDPTGEGLACIRHNWESGADNSPMWDDILNRIPLEKTRDVSALRKDIKSVAASHRPTNENYRRYIYLVDLFADAHYDDNQSNADTPFLVQDAMFNSLLVRSNRGLIRLYNTLGWSTTELEEWNHRTITAMQSKLWDEEAGRFYSYDLRNNRAIRVNTALGLTTLFAGVCRPGQAERLVADLGTSFSPASDWMLCASTSPAETEFNPAKYWRGPIWININWMIYIGLLEYGQHEAAQRLRTDTLTLLEDTGFFEYFDPRGGVDKTARGLGGDGFSWSAALYLDLKYTGRKG